MSLLKLLRMRARNKLRTTKFPITRAGMKINIQVAGYPFCYHNSIVRIGPYKDISLLTEFD